ncbi:hypothetical protein [Streptomyces alfalfae]
MKFTATEKAETAAREVVVWSRRNSNEPITREMVDAILSRDKDMWWGDANVRTVRMWVRKIAILSTDVVALTDREEVEVHRSRFAAMTRDELFALRDQIADDERDPRGWDKNFTQAMSEVTKGFGPDTRTDEEQAMDTMDVTVMNVADMKAEFTRTMNALADGIIPSGSAARLAARLWREMSWKGVEFR